jgi:hypothetical protein
MVHRSTVLSCWSPVFLVCLSGCGLVQVRTNIGAGTQGRTSPAPQGAVAAPEGQAPVAAYQAAPQVLEEPWASELPDVATVRAKIVGANPEDAKAQQDAALKMLVEYLRFRSDIHGGSMGTAVSQQIDQRLIWAEAEEGKEYFALASSAERQAWDLTRKAAAAQTRPLIAHLRRKVGSGRPSAGGGSNGAGDAARSSNRDAEDAAQRRASCLSRCERNCPSPGGFAGIPQSEYDQCRNEISSCRSSCW